MGFKSDDDYYETHLCPPEFVEPTPSAEMQLILALLDNPPRSIEGTSSSEALTLELTEEEARPENVQFTFITLEGGGGDDTITGVVGEDSNYGIASYASATSQVNLGLNTREAEDGDGGRDTLIDLLGAVGGQAGDALRGDERTNVLFGGGGDDGLTGLAGADFLVGGEGFDFANYLYSATGINADLRTDTVVVDQAAGDVDLLHSIEGILGSLQNDTITGNGAANQLLGFGGDDQISGGGGNDTLDGGDGDDTLDGGCGDDVLTGGNGTDTFVVGAHGGNDLQITDFQLGVDQLDLTGYSRVQVEQALAGAQGGAATLSFSNGTVVRVEGENVTAETLTIADMNLRGTPQVFTAEASGGSISGTASDDVINGQAGDDVITGGSGDDDLNGGAGTDTAVFSGNMSSYALTISASGTSILDRRLGEDGNDRLTNIEFLDFASELPLFNGNPVPLSVLDGAASLPTEQFALIIELYIAYFNRAPDAIGLNFWASAFARGEVDLPGMAELFFDQAETRSVYASALSADGSQIVDVVSFVTAIYTNVLGRTPDAGGRDFWVGVLERGEVTPGAAIGSIIEGAKADAPSDATPAELEARALDQQYLQSATEIGKQFAVINGMSDTANADTVMNLLTRSSDSVGEALAQSNQFYAGALNATDGEFLMQIVGVVEVDFTL